MSKRQLIDSLDKELQENTINEIKELFGEEFLTKGRDLKNHQLKILWNRVDYLSSVELYLIGNAIKHNKHNIEWIEDLKNKVRKNKEGSIRGFIYELFISSVISDSILAVEKFLIAMRFKLFVNTNLLEKLMKMLDISYQRRGSTKKIRLHFLRMGNI